MPITLSVTVVGLVVAAGMAAVASRTRNRDPLVPERSEDQLVEAVERHPRLVRFIRHLSRRAAGSLLVAGAFVTVFGLSAFAGALLDMVHAGSGFAQWDESVAEWGAVHSSPGATRVLAAVTHLGSSIGTILVASIVGYLEWRRRRNRDVPLYLAIVYLGHALISNGMKWVVERERPPVEHLVGTLSSSFPSTHSGTAAAMWAATALVLGTNRSRRTQVALAAIAAAITAAVAASRALLGVHWLTDVLAGVAIGWAWFLLVSVSFGGRLIRFGDPQRESKPTRPHQVYVPATMGRSPLAGRGSEPMSSLEDIQSQPIEAYTNPKDRLTWSEMPLRGRTLLGWLVGLALLTAIGVFVGTLITGPLNDSAGAFDRQVAHALGDWRTPTWNDLTMVGSSLADSHVKIPAAVILCGLFLWRWKRWEEAVLLAGSLVLESTAFVTMSFIVDRSRPDIQQLDPIPPTGSFPSGHTGAAVAFYGAIAVIVFWHSRRASIRAIAVAAAILVPPIVAFSRMYRGMHYFSDVTFGALVGFAALVVTYRLLVSRHGPSAAENDVFPTLS